MLGNSHGSLSGLTGITVSEVLSRWKSHCKITSMPQLQRRWLEAADLFPLPLFPAEPGCSPLCTGTAWDLSLDGIW